MYKVTVTEGVVLTKRTIGEAHALVSLLTHELGLVRARATSARAEVSKLRYGLEPLTHARFALVRGKHEWKLTGVEQVSQEFVRGSRDSRTRVGKIAKLLLRLIQGEERVPALYKTVAEGLRALSVAATAEDADAVETVLVLRILSHLGYLPHTKALSQFIEGEYSVEMSAQALKSRSLLVRAINESLIATGL
jgi:DNA repair protein RecO (recombination protein O)